MIVICIYYSDTKSSATTAAVRRNNNSNIHLPCYGLQPTTCIHILCTKNETKVLAKNIVFFCKSEISISFSAVKSSTTTIASTLSL